MENKDTSTWENIICILLSSCLVYSICRPRDVVIYIHHIYSKKWSFLISWSFVWFFLIIFIFLARKKSFQNPQKAQLGLSQFYKALEFLFTFRCLVRINHCTCWNPIYTSLKYHRISSFYERVILVLSSMVTKTVLVSGLPYFSLKLGIRVSWVIRFFFG